LETGAKMPKHVAFTIAGNSLWAQKNGMSVEEGYRACFSTIKEMIEVQIKESIPVFTFLLIPKDFPKHESFRAYSREAVHFFKNLLLNDAIFKNQVKISFWGRWYDLSDDMVEVMKKVATETKNFDKFFVNFCVNYDGQDEIVDAVKIVLRKCISERLSYEDVTKDTIKENLSSSYFLPPDVIIATGGRKETAGLLLWDSSHSKIVLSNKLWPEFDRNEFCCALK
jgi:undecaprenyl diphosphate synthase